MIWVDDDYADLPEIKALEAKGHVIQRLTMDRQLILSRTAHQWTPSMFKIKGLLDVTMKAARDRKRGK